MKNLFKISLATLWILLFTLLPTYGEGVLENLEKEYLLDLENLELEFSELYSDRIVTDEYIPLNQELMEYIKDISDKNNYDPIFILAIIKTESNFDSTCISYNKKSKDVGLMQINSVNFKWLQESLERELDFTNPYDSIEAGIEILNYYKNYWQQQKGYEGKKLLTMTLNSYNMGMGGYKKYMKTHEYNSYYYANRVWKYYEELGGNYGN